MNYWRKVVLFFLACFIVSAEAQQAQPLPFIENPTIKRMAERYASEAIEVSKSRFGVSLNYSAESINDVSKILDKLHQSYVARKGDMMDEEVMTMSKSFGSYIGEVIRRRHGAEWGTANFEGQDFPAVRSRAGLVYLPWSRAASRIVTGPGTALSDDLQTLVQR